MECGEAARDIKAGDEVNVDFDTGVITNVTTGKTYQAPAVPPFIQNIIEKGGLLNSIQSEYWANTAKAMRREESGNIRSTSVFGSYSHAGKCSATPEYSTIHGISQGKEQSYDI